MAYGGEILQQRRETKGYGMDRWSSGATYNIRTRNIRRLIEQTITKLEKKREVDVPKKCILW